MVLKSLLDTAILSESMHKENGSFSAKISWGSQSRVWRQSPLVIPDAHFLIVCSSLMFIVKKFGLLGKNWVGCPTFAGMVLKSLLGTATLSESMHKENERFSTKIS